MSKHFTGEKGANSVENSASMAREMDVSAGVTHVANGAADVTVVVDQSGGHEVLSNAPHAVNGIAEFSFNYFGDAHSIGAGHEAVSLFHEFGDALPVTAAQEYVSSGAEFTILADISHDQNPLSQHGISDGLGDLSGDHLSNIFDNLDVGSGSFDGNSAASWSPGVSADAGHSANMDGLLDVFSDAHSTTTTSSHGGHGGGGTTTSPTPSLTAFTINVTWDASVANAPSGFTTVVNQVVSFFESHFSDPVNVNITVGYGEVDGLSLGSGALGESVTLLVPESYSTITSALSADATSSFDQSAVASLPSIDPAGNFYVSTAEAKALGLMSATGTAIDGHIGFSSQPGIFDYNNTDGVSAGTYDFFGVVAHEISEVLGRILMTGGTSSTGYNMLYDLFHYSSPGVMDFSKSTAGYFSIDGGNTNLNSFNTNSAGDAGDWSGKTVDAFNAFSSPGVVLPVSNSDLTALDVIGWNSSGTTTYSGATSTSSGSLTMAQLENQHPAA